MKTTYGVVWRDGEHALARGKLELLPHAIRVDGMTGSEPTAREIRYEHLSEIRIGRSPDERIDGRPSLVLGLRTGDTLSIASVAQAGVLAEIAERLAALQSGTDGRRLIAFVLPPGGGSRRHPRAARSRSGLRPRRLGLDRHQVILTASEAVFIVRSRVGVAVREPLLQEPDRSQSAAERHHHLPGRHASRGLLVDARRRARQAISSCAGASRRGYCQG